MKFKDPPALNLYIPNPQIKAINFLLKNIHEFWSWELAQYSFSIAIKVA